MRTKVRLKVLTNGKKNFATILKILLIVAFPTERKIFFSFWRNYPRQIGIPDFRSSLGDSIGVCTISQWVEFLSEKALLKFIYSKKATKFCKIFTLLLTVCTAVKSKGKISQNFVAFSEYMNFKFVNWRIRFFDVTNRLFALKISTFLIFYNIYDKSLLK